MKTAMQIIVFVLCLAVVIRSVHSQDQFIDAESFNPNYLESGVERFEMVTLRKPVHLYTDVYDHIYVRQK